MPRRSLKTALFLALQFLLPQHLLSRLVGRVADSRFPPLKNALIRLALRHYRINLAHAEIKDPKAYTSFNAFFIRQLDPPPLFPKAPVWGSPAEAVISEIGATHEGILIQAKGKTYTVAELLAAHATSPAYSQGSFATLYLAPHNYHRVHAPIDGMLTEINYVPGKLFSVNLTTADHISRLFARNERMIFHFETASGKLALIMVGALLVAGMQSPFVHWSRRDMTHFQKKVFPKPLPIEKGDELGYFNFGSTVILVTENKRLPLVQDHTEVYLGQSLFE